MQLVINIIQVIIALGIFNVWLLRRDKSTNWRGGNATTMKEEFAVYGLPGWSVNVIGGLKLLFAALLIAGIWYPGLTQPAAAGVAILMLGAIAMHIKVKDPLQKSLPAFTMMALSLVILLA